MSISTTSRFMGALTAVAGALLIYVLCTGICGCAAEDPAPTDDANAHLQQQVETPPNAETPVGEQPTDDAPPSEQGTPNVEQTPPTQPGHGNDPNYQTFGQKIDHVWHRKEFNGHTQANEPLEVRCVLDTGMLNFKGLGAMYEIVDPKGLDHPLPDQLPALTVDDPLILDEYDGPGGYESMLWIEDGYLHWVFTDPTYPSPGVMIYGDPSPLPPQA